MFPWHLPGSHASCGREMECDRFVNLINELSVQVNSIGGNARRTSWGDMFSDPWRNQLSTPIHRISFRVEKLRRSWKRLRFFPFFLFFFLHFSSLTNENTFSLRPVSLNALWHISHVCTWLNGGKVPKIPLATPKNEELVKKKEKRSRGSRRRQNETLKIKFVTNYEGGWLIAGRATVAAHFFHPISASLLFSKWEKKTSQGVSTFVPPHRWFFFSMSSYQRNWNFITLILAKLQFHIHFSSISSLGHIGTTQRAF